MSLEDGEIIPVTSFHYDPEGLAASEWNAISEHELLVRQRRTLYYFINHDLRPNALVDIQSRQVVASVAMDADQEITLDYMREPLPKRYLQTHGASYLFWSERGMRYDSFH